MTGLVERDILIVAEVVKCLRNILLDMLAQLRGRGRYTLEQQLDVENKVSLRFLRLQILSENFDDTAWVENM